MDGFLISFVAAAFKKMRFAGANCVQAGSKPAVKVLGCAKSIARVLGRTHVSSAFRLHDSEGGVMAQSSVGFFGAAPHKGCGGNPSRVRHHGVRLKMVNGGLSGGDEASNPRCARAQFAYITLSAATAADLSLVTRPVCSGGPSPFQGSWQ
jgi:hypothetical protein